MRQTEALAILNAGANVFLTGAPGAGKTYVLNEFIRQTRADGASVAVTASTGIASTHINGQTIHSWSGVGVATALSPSLLKLIKSRRKRKIQATDILVIDEVSMLHAWLFDMVDQVCREVRRDPRPFGGIQVVLSGDFFQLPPVSVSGRNRDLIAPTPEFIASREQYARAGLNPEGFITESLVWPELNPVICYLTEQHRQDTGELLTVLTDIREGDVTQSDRDVLVTRLGKLPEPGQVAVHLFPVNRQADNLNDMRLNQIMLEPHEFHAETAGPANLVDRLKKNMLAPERLVLKEGAAVMALRNDTDRQYVNGSPRHRARLRAGEQGRLADRGIRKRQHRHHETGHMGNDGRRHRARLRLSSATALRMGHHHPQIARHDARPCGYGPEAHLRAGHGICGAVTSRIAGWTVFGWRQRTHVPRLARCRGARRRPARSLGLGLRPVGR